MDVVRASIDSVAPVLWIRWRIGVCLVDGNAEGRLEARNAQRKRGNTSSRRSPATVYAVELTSETSEVAAFSSCSTVIIPSTISIPFY